MCLETKKTIINRDISFDKSTILRTVTLEKTDYALKSMKFERKIVSLTNDEEYVETLMVD